MPDNDALREALEPFGYWVEQKYAEPTLLRKPAYIPEPSDLRTVTPLYLALPDPKECVSMGGEELSVRWRLMAMVVRGNLPTGEEAILQSIISTLAAASPTATATEGRAIVSETLTGARCVYEGKPYDTICITATGQHTPAPSGGSDIDTGAAGVGGGRASRRAAEGHDLSCSRYNRDEGGWACDCGYNQAANALSPQEQIRLIASEMRRFMPNACGDWADRLDAALNPAPGEPIDIDTAGVSGGEEVLREAARAAHDVLIELNPNNYSHDDVVQANDAAVEAILLLAVALGERHGKTPEWWTERHTTLASTSKADMGAGEGRV